MTLTRSLQIVFALLVVFGATLLGISQDRFELSLAALLGAIASVTLTDITGRFRLTGLTANLAALAAVGFAMLELTGITTDVSDSFSETAIERLSSIANLLLYMQLVVMFQTKTVRIYWQLMMLSFLQVIVAAAWNNSTFFGLLLLGFLIVSLLAMILLQIYDDTSRLVHTVTFRIPEPHDHSNDATTRLARRWNAHKPPTAVPTGNEDGDHFPTPAALHRSVLRHATVLTVGTIVVASLLFLLTPRFGQNNSSWLPARRVGRVQSGYNDHIHFDRRPTPIIQNDNIVMRVWLFDHATGSPCSVGGAIALRGGVAESYDENGWTPRTNTSPKQPPKADPGQRVFRQEFVMSPLPYKTMFSVYPIVHIGAEDSRLFYAPIRRMDHRRPNPEPYQIGTTGFYAGRQHPLIPCPRRPNVKTLLDLPAGDSLKGTKKLATEWIQETAIPPDEPVRQARHLAEHLRGSGEFAYALALPPRDDGIDPIEDFVTNHRHGHCEYFASALALMLRSQGIPARIATGFKTAEYNKIGNYYQVRQLHAHAWTEAYLEADQIPENLKIPGHDYRHGAWLTLDATPTDASVFFDDEQDSVWASLKNAFDHVDLLWRNYVVSYNPRQQQRTVYRPLSEAFSSLTNQPWSRPWAKEIVDKIWAPIKADGWGFVPILRSLAVLLFYAAITVPFWIMFYFAMLRMLPMARRWFSFSITGRNRSSSGVNFSEVDFYRRFERVLSQHDLHRSAGETQREFAMSISGQLAENRDLQSLSSIPRVIADAFYRVRFGNQSLDQEQADSIRRALFDLEQGLSQRHESSVMPKN